MYAFDVENTNQPYLFPEIQTSKQRLANQRAVAIEREEELSTSRILLHLALLLFTAITTTLTGASWAIKSQSATDDSFFSLLFAPIRAVLHATATGDKAPLLSGLLFTFTLLTILGAHELGHYFACRHYGIRASLPFFLPAPPVISLFGTFGAVIKIKEPITTRRALFDIGIAGPLAGFAFALPAALIGLLSAEPTLPTGTSGIQFNDPLLFIAISKIFGISKWVDWNPVYWASWGALLVTALNLFPVGQLDGGHVLYAVFGRRIHKWISLIICISVATLSVVSYMVYNSPMWFLWTFILFFLFKVGHPPVIEEEPLGKTRIALAVLALIVFLLCFMPFPITVAG
jgi:membrane-associated protease RseP (regulator of RpoE activity)